MALRVFRRLHHLDHGGDEVKLQTVYEFTSGVVTGMGLVALLGLAPILIISCATDRYFPRPAPYKTEFHLKSIPRPKVICGEVGELFCCIAEEEGKLGSSCRDLKDMPQKKALDT
jgi:hypothetical protein